MKIFIFFPKDSEALFNKNSERTFGGASVQLYNLAKGLKKYTDCSIYSLIPNYNIIDFQESELFDFIKIFSEKDNFLVKFIKTHNVIRKSRPDFIIQRGLTLFSCLLALYCKMSRVKFIFMYAHDNESSGRYQKNGKKCPLYRLIPAFSFKLIVQNLHQLSGINKKFCFKTEILESAYEIPLRPADHRKKKSILWVSRLEPWKSPEKFIDLSKKFPKLNFRMIAPLFHREIEYGNQIIMETENIPNLEYIPFVNLGKINDYFQEAMLFVNTSKFEGFPNTFIQAAMNSTPILSFNVNPNNVINDHNMGFFCENDSNKAERYIKKFIGSNDFKKQQSENSYAYARKNHDVSIIIGKLMKIMEKNQNCKNE